MMNSEPKLLHAMLKNLADSIIEYSCYQIEAGAQVIQVSEQSKRAFWKAKIRATTKLTLFHSITFAARRRKNIHKRELSGFKPQDPLPEQLV